jgi:hypothetical protein
MREDIECRRTRKRDGKYVRKRMRGSNTKKGYLGQEGRG